MSSGTFLLSILGQITDLKLTTTYCSSKGYYCKYEFVHNTPDWTIIGGSSACISQTAYAGQQSGNNPRIVFNLPIDIVYRSTNPFGWPQIVVSVYDGKNLVGYSRIHIPLQPGLHNLSGNLSKPIPSTFIGQLTAALFGQATPELVQPQVLTTGVNLLRMVDHGNEVNLSLNVLVQNFQALNFDAGNAIAANDARDNILI